MKYTNEKKHNWSNSKAKHIPCTLQNNPVSKQALTFLTLEGKVTLSLHTHKAAQPPTALSCLFSGPLVLQPSCPQCRLTVANVSLLFMSKNYFFVRNKEPMCIDGHADTCECHTGSHSLQPNIKTTHKHTQRCFYFYQKASGVDSSVVTLIQLVIFEYYIKYYLKMVND